MTDTNNQNTAVLPSTAVLTEESFTTLKSMLRSNNIEDHKMAQLILNQLDIQSNIVYIRELAKYYSHNMVNLRTKASRKFRDDCSLFWLGYSNTYEFARWLNNKGWLTPEIYQGLKPEIVKSLSNRDDHKFYKLSFEIRDEFKHLDPDQNLQPLKSTKNE